MLVYDETIREFEGVYDVMACKSTTRRYGEESTTLGHASLRRDDMGRSLRRYDMLVDDETIWEGVYDVMTCWSTMRRYGVGLCDVMTC